MGLALLACAATLSACGTKGQRASGVLVFSGLGSGSYLHAIRPDGSALREIALPKNCSPKWFTRDGHVLSCDEWTEPWGTYAATRRGETWRRVPRPPAWKFPAWVAKGMSYESEFALDAPEWARGRGRIVLIRRLHAPYGDIWFSSTGNVVVADGEGRQRVVARKGEVPTWSPDGTQLAFARCRVNDADPGDESAVCSIWTVAADKPESARKLADDVASAPVWSPDGRFIAFFRKTSPCGVACKGRIIVVAAKGGAQRPVGPQLTEPSELFWLPDRSSAVAVRAGTTLEQPRRLQRCVDIWNRARMQWRGGPANVRLVRGRCQVTVAAFRSEGLLSAGFDCRQPVPFSFECPSHGARLVAMNPAQRVWNAQLDHTGKLTLARPPTGPRLALPKAPPYPLLDGYVLPFTSDGQPRRGLVFTATRTGTCFDHGYVDHPDSLRCGWVKRGFTYLDNYCFKAPGRLHVGDAALCSEGAGSTRFIRLKLSKLNGPIA